MCSFFFLHSISSGYSYSTAGHLREFKVKLNKKKMLNDLNRCIKMYHAMELTVTQLNTDNECTCVEDDIRLVKLNVLVACEYVENIESSNRTVKEGTR